MNNFLKILVPVLLFSACAKDKGKVNFGEYPNDIGEIISTNCATSGCHNDASNKAAAGLNMQTWSKLFSGSNSGLSVIPFNSKFSSLCFFINTYPELGLTNEPTMPINKSPLSKEQVLTIKNWIDAGAPNLNGDIPFASNPLRKKLYAVNQGCDVVTVIDAETQLPMRYIPVGNKAGADTPHQIRVSADGKYWYVIFINNNIMQKFDCSNDSYIGDIPLTPVAAGTSSIGDALDWNTFVISNDSKRAYCVSWQTNGKVCAVDLEKRKLLHFVGGMFNPHGVMLDKTNENIYITAQAGNCIRKYDTAFFADNLYSLVNGQNPSENSNDLLIHDIILGKNKDEILVTCQKSNDVRVFNTLTNSVTAIIPTGEYPQEIVFNANKNEYYVSCTEDTTSFVNARGTITRINASSYSTTKIAVGYQPHGIAVDESKNLLYVLSRNRSGGGVAPHHTSNCAGRNGFVNFIDLNNFTIQSKKYELSVDPYFIFAR